MADYGTDSENERQAEKLVRVTKERRRAKESKENKRRRAEKTQEQSTRTPTNATTTREKQEIGEGDSVSRPIFQKGVGGQWEGMRGNPTTITIDIPQGDVTEPSTVLKNDEDTSQPPPQRETIDDLSGKGSAARAAPIRSLLDPLWVDRNVIVTRRATRMMGEADPDNNPEEDVATIDEGVASQEKDLNPTVGTIEGIARTFDNPLTENVVYQDIVPVFDIEMVVTSTDGNAENSMEPIGTGVEHVATGQGNSQEIRQGPVIDVAVGMVGMENLTLTMGPLDDGASEDGKEEEGEGDPINLRLKYPDPAGERLHKVVDRDTGEIAPRKNVSKKNKKCAKGTKGKKGPKSADA